MNASEPFYTSPEAVKPNDGHEYLHQLSTAYITACKNELKKLGLTMRSAMELEFTLEDSAGKVMPYGILMNANKRSKHASALQALKAESAPYSDYIQKLNYENVNNNYRISIPYQYEVNIADPGNLPFDPLAVAEATERVKSGALKSMLLSSTHHAKLYKAGLATHLPLMPNFKARPYPDDETGFGKRQYFEQDCVTSALHDNISIYDTHGHNLFATSPALLNHCAHSLLEIQNNAGITFLPGINSLKRIGANKTSPSGIGIGFGDKLGTSSKYISVNIRRDHGLTSNSDEIRLENRLPGADADPLVCQALTLAALVDAVRQHMHKQAGDSSSDEHVVTSEGNFQIDAAPLPPSTRYDIPDRGTLIDRFASNKHMRELLGAEFHRAILSEYGKDKGASVS